MSDVKPRIRLPRSAKAGQAAEVKTLVSHVMETGLRKDADGNTIPRNIINRFTCEYGGEMVLDMQLEGAVSANPYVEFDIMVSDATEVVFTWYEDGGAVYTQTEELTVG